MCKVSVVIPSFNEERVVGKVVRGVIDVLTHLGIPHEVIVVDDGSTDRTSDEARKSAATVIRHPYNVGNGAAVKRGIRQSKGDVIVLMDGDGQHDPNDIPRLLEYASQYEMVVGARNSDSEISRHRSLANVLYNSLASYIVGKRVVDLTSGFRLMNAQVARKIVYLFPNGFSYPSTSTIAMFRAGYTVKYVPIKAAARIGKSKIKLTRDGIKFLFIIARLGTFFTPLKIFIPLGAMVFFPGFLYALYRLAVGLYWTLPIVISITGGLLIFAIGLISEQIAMLRLSRLE